MPSTILFYEPLTPRTYLEQALMYYPYDISRSLVFTLLSKDPYPHPALLEFIDFLRHTHKYLLCASTLQEPPLDGLYQKLCMLAQRNHVLLHAYQFHLDALFHITSYPIYHPYAYLSLEKVSMVDKIQLCQPGNLTLDKEMDVLPITWKQHFPFPSLSIDPDAFIALSIQIAHVNGLLFLPKDASSLLIALASLYQVVPPSSHPKFLLFYGRKQPQPEHILSYDSTNDVYLGCFSKTSAEYSLSECTKMIQSLYSMITLKKADLTIQATMLSIKVSQKEIGIVLCGEANSGKSEFSQTLLSLCKKQGIPIHKIFASYGTLHCLDEALSMTGAQIGAIMDTASLSKKAILELRSSCIQMSEAKQHTTLLSPFTTYENTCEFHPVHLFLYFDHERQKDPLTLFTLEEAMKRLPKTTALYDPSLCAATLPLWEKIINTIYLNELPLYHMKITKHNKKLLCKKLLEQLQIIGE